VVVDDLSERYVGGGTAIEVLNGWPRNPLNTLTINHITAFPDPTGHMMIAGNSEKHPHMYGFVFTNNLIVTGEYPIWNTGGHRSCARRDVPITTMQRCFANSTFANNALIASPPQFPPASWPAKNMFAQTIDDVGFTNYNDSNGGDYTLLSSSPYKNKGTDGKDLGADIVGLNAALANVE